MPSLFKLLLVSQNSDKSKETFLLFTPLFYRMKEALFYKKLKDKTVQCLLCPRNCIIKNKESVFAGQEKTETANYFH